jgi:dTDP-glucose pyrophosphorylase/predicted transcriptional regulator
MDSSEQLWALTILSVGSSVRQAVQVLNETSLKIVLVVDANEVLVGTISDGDIRRGLLKGLELNSTIDSIVHEDALVVPFGLSREVVLQLMTANKIQQIPIVDENKHVIGLHLWDQINARTARTNIMVIMAGGKGTRLHPQTENCPKPLLPIAGKPILEHIIDHAKVEGFSHFVLAIHYLGHMIEEYFGNGDALGVKIEYLREESPLGTAGALSLLEPLPESPFVVTNGDVLTDIHYGELLDFHIQHNAKATMAVRVHEWQNPFGVVETEGIDIRGYDEKPITRTQINAGVYVLEPSAIRVLSKSLPCDMPTLFDSIRKQEMRTVAYPIHERWLDVGRPEDLMSASAEPATRNEK